MPYYTAGDYYMAGGLFGSIGKFLGGVVKKVAPVASLLPGPVGMMAGLLGGAGKATPPKVPTLPTQTFTAGGGLNFLKGMPLGTGPAFSTPLLTGGPSVEAAFTKGLAKGRRAATLVVDPVTGQVRRRTRRMNVTNARALRRAIRRAKGFANFARSVTTITTRGWRGVRFKGTKRRR